MKGRPHRVLSMHESCHLSVRPKFTQVFDVVELREWDGDRALERCQRLRHSFRQLTIDSDTYEIGYCRISTLWDLMLSCDIR
jgi:hypothetical protein